MTPYGPTEQARNAARRARPGSRVVEPRRLDQWFDRGIAIIAEQTDFAPQRKSALVVFRSLALRDRSRVVSLGVSDASAVSVAASPGYVRAVVWFTRALGTQIEHVEAVVTGIGVEVVASRGDFAHVETLTLRTATSRHGCLDRLN